MRTKRRYVATTLTTALLGVGVAVAVHFADRPEESQQVPLTIVTVASTSNSSDTFGVTATTVTGLYPGATRNLVLTLTNPYSFDIKVTDLSASLAGTSSPACAATAANLTVRPYQAPPSLPVTLTANQVKAVGAIPLVMPRTVANGCQGATFTLSLTGTATKVNK
jgi:hypothetical protein